MIKITIDNREFEVENGLTVLQVCKQNEIKIPTLCYDERLKPHSACRLCVVEIEGRNNLLSSCSLEVSEGMVVQTNTKRVRKARYDILDLMFSNHPNDCLTCEKAGNCQLQDYCFEYGVKSGSFKGENRKIPMDKSNKFYDYMPAKCILCGRCVQVCSQLQQTYAIDFKGRGFNTSVGSATKLDDGICVSCGNCVSVCPVGALMPKMKTPVRQWQMKEVKTTCAYCGVGCQLDLQVTENKVLGAQPINVQPNDGLLCVKGKFAYKYINHEERIKTPLIKKDGEFVEASWEEALSLVANKMVEYRDNFGGDSIAGLTSARCTNEENYLFQKMFRAGLKTNNIDHCARL